MPVCLKKTSNGQYGGFVSQFCDIKMFRICLHKCKNTKVTSFRTKSFFHKNIPLNHLMCFFLWCEDRKLVVYRSFSWPIQIFATLHLRVLYRVTGHEVRHREASLAEETKGFGTRHVMDFLHIFARCNREMLVLFFVTFCLGRRVLECQSFWQQSRSQVLAFELKGSHALVFIQPSCSILCSHPRKSTLI